MRLGDPGTPGSRTTREVIKSAYVMGVVQNHFYHAVKEKNMFWEKTNLLWNTEHLDVNDDVKHYIFCCLVPLIWMILLRRTEIL